MKAKTLLLAIFILGVSSAHAVDTNLALNKPTTGSGGNPSSVNDAATTTWWSVYNLSYNQWVEIDLQDSYSINKLNFIFTNYADRNYDYKVEVSNGTDAYPTGYTTVSTHTSAPQIDVCTFDAVWATKVRVTITGCSNNCNGYSQIRDIKVIQATSNALNSIKNTETKAYFVSSKNKLHAESNDELIKSIRIYNIQGMLVKQLNEINSKIIDINLSNFSAGIYLVETSTSTGKVFSKIRK